MKSAIPDEPKQAAKDAVSAAKDSLPEPPSNPFQSFFSGKLTPVLKIQCCGFSCDWSVAWRLRSLLAAQLVQMPHCGPLQADPKRTLVIHTPHSSLYCNGALAPLLGD